MLRAVGASQHVRNLIPCYRFLSRHFTVRVIKIAIRHSNNLSLPWVRFVSALYTHGRWKTLSQEDQQTRSVFLFSFNLEPVCLFLCEAPTSIGILINSRTGRFCWSGSGWRLEPSEYYLLNKQKYKKPRQRAMRVTAAHVICTAILKCGANSFCLFKKDENRLR